MEITIVAQNGSSNKN